MFFNSRPEVRTEPQPVALKIDPYAKLKEFYFHEIDGQKLLVTLSNGLKTSNAIVQLDEGTIWKVSYLGEVLEFLNNTIQQIGANVQPNVAMAKWLGGHVPVNINPQIEIAPDKIVDYVLQAIKKHPTKQFALFVEQLENFKIGFEACEIVENLRAQ